MIAVTWNPDEQNAVGPYQRERSFRARAASLFLAASVFLVAVFLVALLHVAYARSSADGVGSSSDFELREYLIDNRPGVDRAEWIQR